ncbi:MAG: hypothetical protein Q9166_000278 [cf. Caloplaca sp. 2 TL-2023]
MSPSAWYLANLEKFDRKVAAPLAKHKIDFLGLHEDAVTEIAHLKKKGVISSSTRESHDGAQAHSFAQSGAAVGDEKALEVVGYAAEPGDSRGREEVLEGKSVDSNDEDRWPRPEIRRAKSLSNPRPKWYHTLGFGRRRKFIPSPPASPSRSLRSLSPRPHVRTETAAVPADSPRPRRRLSKKIYRFGKSGISNVPLHGEVEDVPYVHPDHSSSREHPPDTRTSVAGTDANEHAIDNTKIVAQMAPLGPAAPAGSSARKMASSRKADKSKQSEWSSMAVVDGSRNDDARSIDKPYIHPDNIASMGEQQLPSAMRNTVLNNQSELKSYTICPQGKNVRFEDGRRAAGRDDDDESESDSSAITYNDGTERGNQKRIRLLERLNRRMGVD